MSKDIVTICLCLALLSCSTGNSEGPCEWDERKFSATVTSIDFLELNNEGDSLFTVMMDFDAGSLSEEEQDLGKLRNMEITKQKIKENRIKVNAIYTGKINDLLSGNCQTPIVAFDQKLN